MVTVPGFLLRRLYVKGSLRYEDGGFAFELRNTLGSGYAHAMRPVTFDGEAARINSTYFILEGVKTSFAEVSRERTFTLGMNKTITITVEGVALEPGTHRIGMGFDVPGLGTLRFDVLDTIV